MLKTDDSRPNSDKNGHAAGLRRRESRKNGRSNGSPTVVRKSEALDSSRRLSSLLVALARGLFGGDDQMSALPLRQLRVCAILHGGPKSMSEIGRELGVSLSAMTQIADRLERAHLVKRSFEGTDRRVRCLQLTARGQRIMRLREDARTKRVSQVLKRLTVGEQAEVIGALEILLQACEGSKL